MAGLRVPLLEDGGYIMLPDLHSNATLVYALLFQRRYVDVSPQVSRIALSRNIIQALRANKDIPPLDQYPRADQVGHNDILLW
jgi:hypothetical protein